MHHNTLWRGYGGIGGCVKTSPMGPYPPPKPEVNLRECVTSMPLPSMIKATHYGFETQGRCQQKSKTGGSLAPQKGLMSSKKILKNCWQVFVMFLINFIWKGLTKIPEQHCSEGKSTHLTTACETLSFLNIPSVQGT